LEKLLIRIGIVGKTNTGKTTFFNAATLLSAEVSTYPFTTKTPNVGRANVQTICVCKELKLKDNPQNSVCLNGWRFIPVELVDLPGLIKGSWMGKGLGTQFLSVASQADALLHVVDVSGSVDAEGKITRPGLGNPVIDVIDIEEELVLWFSKVIQKSVKKVAKRVEQSRVSFPEAFSEALSGIKVRREQIQKALESTDLGKKKIGSWTEKDFMNFAREIRTLSKPTILIANKMDIAQAEKNFERLREEFKASFVIPCSSEAELALRRAEQKGIIKYIPGEETFNVLDENKLTPEQKSALNYVQQRVLPKLIGTGVQSALNMCVFKLLGMNTVYPVEDASRLADKRGNILPDVFLTPNNSTVRDLAREIHTDLEKTMIYAIDVRTGLRLPVDYTPKDRDIISIIAAARKG
jgi:ribosome-binding ATPase YchF (GTP1/OBG family)